MKRLNRFIQLSRGERLLLIKAALLLTGIRLALGVFRFPAVHRFLERRVKTSSRVALANHDGQPEFVDSVVWSVTAASRYVPFTSNCLTKALAAELLLKRLGQPAVLCLGVALGKQKDLKAHAWIEVEGRIVIGGAEARSLFVPLPALKEFRE
jgi:transglutaminase superfamily protein